MDARNGRPIGPPLGRRRERAWRRQEELGRPSVRGTRGGLVCLVEWISLVGPFLSVELTDTLRLEMSMRKYSALTKILK